MTGLLTGTSADKRAVLGLKVNMSLDSQELLTLEIFFEIASVIEISISSMADFPSRWVGLTVLPLHSARKIAGC